MKRREFSLALYAAVALCGCQVIAGITDRSARAHTCLHNSDCPAADVCLFQTCTLECLSDRDCALGARCLDTETGRGCVTPPQAACNTGAACPVGTVCSDGACRTPCAMSDGAACRTDQTCSSANTCIGNDSMHESLDGGLGGQGGVAGAGGASAGSGGDAGSSSGRGGTSGGVGGNCGGSVEACTGATSLADAVLVNDIALAASTVYFTTDHGLAKVTKTGGVVTPIAGFSNVGGLALESSQGQTLIVVVDGSTGTLTTVSDNGMTTPFAKSCHVGTGDVLVDDGSTSGNAAVLFTAGDGTLSVDPGGALTELAGDVWSATPKIPDSRPSSSSSIAFDVNNVYYLGIPINGNSQNTVMGAARNGVGDTCTLPHGTVLAIPNGTPNALIGDGHTLYFLTLGANGVSSTLSASAIVAPALAAATPIPLAMLTASPNAPAVTSSALALDDTYLYFSGFAGIYRVLVSGPDCTPAMLPCSPAELLVSNVTVSALAVDDGNLYFGIQSGAGGLYRIKKTP